MLNDSIGGWKKSKDKKQSIIRG